MTYQSGKAVAFYELNIDQPKRAAAELRQLFQGIQQQTIAAPVLPAPDPQASAGIQSYVASLRQVGPAALAAASPIAQMVADLRAEGAALGQTDDQINAHIAALSREALAAGDVTRALELEEAALGITGAQQADGTQKTLARATAEARAALAARDYAGAQRIVATELQAQGERTVGVINAERQLIQITNQATAAAEKAALVEQRQADGAIRIAQQQARAAVATKDYAGALQILNTAQTENAGGSALALASLETQITQVETAGTVTGAFGAQLASLVNPLTLVTVGLGIAASGAKSFGEALQFGGQLEEERKSFGGILGDFSKGNAILDEATQRTRAYGFTTKETTDAFRELAPIIRESTSSTRDQAEALARISVLHPDDPVKALSSAIEGIKIGRFRELAKDVSLNTAEQAALKNQVDGGRDAFIALNDVLDRHGITLQVAKERTEGLIGAEREQAQAAEDLTKAESDFGSGAGIAFTQLKTAGIRAFNDIISSPGARQLFSANLGVSLGEQLGRIIFGTNQATVATDANTAANAQGAAQSTQSANAIALHATAFDEDRIALGKAQIAAQQKSTADKVAAIDAQTHGIAEEKLARQAQFAAEALLRAGPAGARTAALLAGSSQQVDILTAAYYRLAAAKAAGAVTDPLKGITEDRLTRDTPDDRNAGRIAGRAAATAAELARQQQLVQTGTAAQKAAVLQQQYNDAVKQFGANSKEAINAQTNIIQAQQAAEKAADKAGRTRVNAAASTALQLQNTEENSQLQLLRTQREGLERLRDQQEDFDVRRVRSKEDEDRKIRGLLARGQIAEANRERENFARDQQRTQEDFDREKRRTLRNNQEGLGDIGARTDLRQEQIGARAALRGTKANGGATLGGGIPPATLGGGDAQSAGPRVISITFPSAIFSPDGQKLGDIVYPFVSQRLDNDLSIEIRTTTPPGGAQNAVSGARP